MTVERIDFGTPTPGDADTLNEAIGKLDRNDASLDTRVTTIEGSGYFTPASLVTNLTTNDTTRPAAANTVKTLKDQFDALTAGGGIPPIANNLTTSTTGSTLDATQGKVLNDNATALTTRVTTLEGAGYVPGASLVSTYGSDTILNSSTSLLSSSRRMSFVERGVGIMVDVSGLGTGGNITTRIQNALALIPSGGTIIIPNGTWQVTVDTIRLNSGQSVRGESIGGVNLTTNVASLFAEHGVFLVQLSTTISNISIVGINVTSTNNDYILLRAHDGSVNKCYISDCTFVNCRCAKFSGASSQIFIERCYGSCTGTWTNTQGQGQFIYVAYSFGWMIRDCSGTGYQHGIQGWGGSTGVDVATTSRPCGEAFIENCHFNDPEAASIWFANCRDIVVSGCRSLHGVDVAFDCEGCTDVLWYNCHAVDPGSPTAGGSVGAGFSNLYSALRVSIVNCSVKFIETMTSVTTETLGQTVVKFGGGKGSYFYIGMGGSNTPNVPRFEGVQILNCRFEAAAPAKDGKFVRIANFRPDVGDGHPLYDSLISGNTLINGTIQLGYDKDRYYRILNNNIEIRIASFVAEAAIQIGGQSLIWPATSQFESAHVSNIRDNIITFTAAQFAGTAGIKVNWPLLATNAHQGVNIFSNEVRQAAPGTPTAIDFGIYVVNTTTQPGAKWIRSGDNVLPDSYLNSGQPIKFEETGATSLVSWINASRSVRAASGFDCHTLSLTSRVALTPVSVSGSNKFLLAAGSTGAAALTESGIAVGDQIQTSGITTTANNGNWLVTAVTNTGTGASSGECSLTVTTTAGVGGNLTPVSVSGTNKFLLAAGAAGAAVLSASGINTGDTIITSGATTSANNGTWVVSAITNTGTGASSGECSFTVTAVGGGAPGLTNETLGGTPILRKAILTNETLGGTPAMNKMVRAGRVERIRVYAPTGTTIASNILRNTGIPLTRNMRYEAQGPVGSVWEYKPRCEADGTLTVYATNLRSADAVPPVETISVLQTTRI